MSMSTWERAGEATSFIRRQAGVGDGRLEAALVLGSGLGDLAGEFTDTVFVPYSDIPYFPVSTVEGHAGRFVVGRLSGRLVCAMQGRFHYYEGYSMGEVTYPIRVTQRLGVGLVILTNAAGGVNPDFEPGDLMLITDHQNLLPESPLRGPNDPRFGPRFPSPVGIYSASLLEAARQAAARAGFGCREGVYAALAGPGYETEAEARYLRLIGADAVGMSTVPEALVAGHGGQRVLAVSSITNVLGRQPGRVVSHGEVLEMAGRVRARLGALIRGVLEGIPA